MEPFLPTYANIAPLTSSKFDEDFFVSGRFFPPPLEAPAGHHPGERSAL